MNRNPVLYVEDDENEVFLMRRVFKQAAIANPLHIVPDGQQAMTYLMGATMFRNSQADLFPSPCLVLLDLHLPGLTGFEVLRWIRARRDLSTLVVIIFSSSQDPQELALAYALGANSFIAKPASLDDRLEFARLLNAWWLGLNQAPPLKRCDAGAETEAFEGSRVERCITMNRWRTSKTTAPQ